MILLLAAIALAGVLALLNGAADRFHGQGRRHAMLLCVVVAAGVAGVLMGVAGFRLTQAIVLPAVCAPMVLGVFIAKHRLRRALHLPA